MMNTVVNVVAGNSSVSFNCGHGEAEAFKARVLSLLV